MLHDSRLKALTNTLTSWILGSKSMRLQSTNGCLGIHAGPSRSQRCRWPSIHRLLIWRGYKCGWSKGPIRREYRNGFYNESTQRRELHNHKRGRQHGLRWHSPRVLVPDNRWVKCPFALTRNPWKDKHLGGQVCQRRPNSWHNSDIRYGWPRWDHIKRARWPLRHNFPKLGKKIKYVEISLASHLLYSQKPNGSLTQWSGDAQTVSASWVMLKLRLREPLLCRSCMRPLSFKRKWLSSCKKGSQVSSCFSKKARKVRP